MNPGEVIKQNGEVMIYLSGEDPKKCLALDERNMLEVVDVEGAVEIIEKYEYLTIFLKNRLFFLNEKFGGSDEMQ